MFVHCRDPCCAFILHVVLYIGQTDESFIIFTCSTAFSKGHTKRQETDKAVVIGNNRQGDILLWFSSPQSTTRQQYKKVGGYIHIDFKKVSLY